MESKKALLDSTLSHPFTPRAAIGSSLGGLGQRPSSRSGGGSRPATPAVPGSRPTSAANPAFAVSKAQNFGPEAYAEASATSAGDEMDLPSWSWNAPQHAVAGDAIPGIEEEELTPAQLALLRQRGSRLVRGKSQIVTSEALKNIHVSSYPWKVYTYRKRSPEELQRLQMGGASSGAGGTRRRPGLPPRATPTPDMFRGHSVYERSRTPHSWFSRRGAQSLTPSGRRSAPLEREPPELSPESSAASIADMRNTPMRDKTGNLELDPIRPTDWHALDEKLKQADRITGAYVTCSAPRSDRGVESRFGVRNLRGGSVCMMRVHHANRPEDSAAARAQKKERDDETREDWFTAVRLSAEYGFSRKKLFKDIQNFKTFSGRDGKVSKRELMPLLERVGFVGQGAMRYVFNFLDRDQTDSVTFEEFVVGLAELKTLLTEAETQRVYQKFDEDGNGYVNRADVIIFFRNVSKTYEKRVQACRREMSTLPASFRTTMRAPPPAPPSMKETIEEVELHIHEIFGIHGFNEDQMIHYTVFVAECSRDEVVDKFVRMYSRLLAAEEKLAELMEQHEKETGQTLLFAQNGKKDTAKDMQSLIAAAAAGRMWGSTVRKEAVNADGKLKLTEKNAVEATIAHDQIRKLYKPLRKKDVPITPAEKMPAEAMQKREEYANILSRQGQDASALFGEESSFAMYSRLRGVRSTTPGGKRSPRPKGSKGDRPGSANSRWTALAKARRLGSAAKKVFKLNVPLQSPS
ncbi:hypothetical protein RI054_18g82730 [Pseudoscourfieldia marina]